MRYRKLTQSGDYTFGRGDNSDSFYIDTAQAAAQAVLTALLLHQGEFFLNLQAGMPWETQVIGYGTQSLYDAAIKKFVLSVQGGGSGPLVQSIDNYSSSLDTKTRKLTISMTLTTIFGSAGITAAFNPLTSGQWGISDWGSSRWFSGPN